MEFKISYDVVLLGKQSEIEEVNYIEFNGTKYPYNKCKNFAKINNDLIEADDVYFHEKDYVVDYSCDINGISFTPSDITIKNIDYVYVIEDTTFFMCEWDDSYNFLKKIENDSSRNRN